MNRGQVNYAERKALEMFDRWNDAVGVFVVGTGYYAEIKACIVDAVHIGIQMALYEHVKIKEGDVVIGSYGEEDEIEEALK